MTDLQPPITKIKRQGSTHQGVAHWKWQRISGVCLIFLSLWFLVEIFTYALADYHTVVTWAGSPWIGAALALFVGMVFYHGALGLQVLIEDYVPNSFWQMALIIIVKILSIIMAVLSWFFNIRIAIIANG
jgi:succinate dehydrogenase / fumarate reductase membrane anchor subunit